MSTPSANAPLDAAYAEYALFLDRELIILDKVVDNIHQAYEQNNHVAFHSSCDDLERSMLRAATFSDRLIEALRAMPQRSAQVPQRSAAP